MYILSSPMKITSSCTTAASEHHDETKDGRVPQVNPNVKKRKRTYEAEDSRPNGPFSILTANYLYHTSLQTPTPSTSSFLSENLQLQSLNSPTRTYSTGDSFPATKRIQLAPASRARPSPARSYSDTHLLTQIPNLHPCHICHRRPTTLQDLPAYSDCESCQQRTCFVCMRTCEGPRCHLQNPGHEVSTVITSASTSGKNICGKCCVEVGVEGRVWCLACYEDDADLEDPSRGILKKELQFERAERVADWLQDCGGVDGQ